jgi:hypothetical protein
VPLNAQSGVIQSLVLKTNICVDLTRRARVSKLKYTETDFREWKLPHTTQKLKKKFLRGTQSFDCGTESLDLEGIAIRLRVGLHGLKGQEIVHYIYSSGFLRSDVSGIGFTWSRECN